MALDINQIKQGVSELGDLLTAKDATTKALVDAQATSNKVRADNAASQKVADDALSQATIDDQTAANRIKDEVNWLIKELNEDPNAGPDPNAPPSPPVPPVPPTPGG